LQIRVNGPDTAPVYKFLKANKSGFLCSRIKWNFTKFLVDKEGKVLQRYGPTTSPLSIEVLLSLSLFISHSSLRICNDILCEKCSNLKLFSFAFTEGHQDGIGGGMKDSTITSNWCSLVEDDWNIRNVYL